MTYNVGTEAIYVRQLGMHFGVLNSVSNPAEGVRHFSVDDELGVGKKMAEGAIPILLKALARLENHAPKCEEESCAGETYSIGYIPFLVLFVFLFLIRRPAYSTSAFRRRVRGRYLVPS